MAWALTWSMSAGVRPASWIARVIACPARSPLGSGATMWKPSEVTLAPMIRARMLAPRALACSSVSITINAPPSPNTKPLRSLSNGRHAPAGSSLLVDNTMRILANPAIGTASILVSTPPQIAMSASPSTICCQARAMPSEPDAHADTERHHPGLGVPFQPDRRGRAVGHVLLHGQRGDRPHTRARACRRSRRPAPRPSPCRCRWTPSTGWYRPRASRRSPTPAGPARWPSSAGSPSGAVRSASAGCRTPPTDARRCGPAGRTPRRTGRRAYGFHFGRPAATSRWSPRRLPVRSSWRCR